jgi:hypothetical protein
MLPVLPFSGLVWTRVPHIPAFPQRKPHNVVLDECRVQEIRVSCAFCELWEVKLQPVLLFPGLRPNRMLRGFAAREHSARTPVLG